MRFAGDRGKQIEADRQQRRADRERRIEQFREDHANLRSKGYSEEAAQQGAEHAHRSGERPGRSSRYRRLNGED